MLSENLKRGSSPTWICACQTLQAWELKADGGYRMALPAPGEDRLSCQDQLLRQLAKTTL